jgi:hypothetical protein
MPAILIKLDHYTTKDYAPMATESKRYYENLATTAGLDVAGVAASPFTTPPVPALGLQGASDNAVEPALMSAADLRTMAGAR